MAITDSEFLEKQQKYSRSIDQIDQISGEDVQNSVTLPGVLLDENGLPKKFVQARMSVFTQPAIDAAAQCQNALQQLTAALSDAAAALSEAQRVRSEMESATETATTAANKASQDAQAAISNANAALSNAQSALADAQTALANAASSKQTTDGLNSDLQRYLAQVSELITTLQQSIASADDTANHPTYIGADNYVYQWNKQTKAYTKTNIYVRGEGFHTSKTFNSVAEMEAYDGTGLKEGDFVVINTNDVENPDNAKLYTYDGNGGFDFFVDMSGAIGFTGKTPQISIGTITTLPAGSSASASLSDDGTDIDGNPKFKLNLSLPKGDPFTYADFTAEQIAELQRPATEAIALCNAAKDAANTAAQNTDTARTRIEGKETQWEQNEQTRQANEQTRQTNEQARRLVKTVMEMMIANPPKTGEELGHTGDYHWYKYVVTLNDQNVPTGQYMMTSAISKGDKGDNLNYDDMTDAEKAELVNQIKDSLIFATSAEAYAIWDGYTFDTTD